MATEPMTARQHLEQEIRHALETGEDATGLVDRVIRVGWQPPLEPHCDSDHLRGVLDSGRHVSIEVRHAPSRSSRNP